MNANENKFAAYKQDCHNAMNKGRDEYPKTIIEAHTELEEFRFNPRIYQINRNQNNKKKTIGHQFLNETDEGTEPEKQDAINNRRKHWGPKKPYMCNNCDRMNECISYDCPHTKKESLEPTRDERRRLQRGHMEQRTPSKETHT